MSADKIWFSNMNRDLTKYRVLMGERYVGTWEQHPETGEWKFEPLHDTIANKVTEGKVKAAWNERCIYSRPNWVKVEEDAR